MNCLESRRLTLINPNDENPARLAHNKICASCSSFLDKMLLQDELVREAAKVDTPEGFAARILLNQSFQSASRRPTRVYWLGLAASLFLAVALLPSVVEDLFSRPLETELVAPVDAHDMLGSLVHAADPSNIRQVLAAAGTDMPSNFGNILSATTCVVDGEVMAHLLVANGEDQYIVFLIPQSSLKERSFDQDDWAGQIARINNRSIAVLARNGSDLQLATDAFTAQFSQPLSSG